MKLYAQQGYGDGEKTVRGLNDGLIDGVIISPRDIRADAVARKIEEYREANAGADILLDPQFYATFAAASETARIGKLPEWPYFATVRKSDLEVTSEVEAVLSRTFDHIISLPVTAVIAPNIYISRSFDSREAVIAKNFIRQARGAYQVLGDRRPLLVTLGGV